MKSYFNTTPLNSSDVNKAVLDEELEISATSSFHARVYELPFVLTPPACGRP